MSPRSWAVVCLCLGFSLAGIGCGGSSLNGSIVDGSGGGIQKTTPGAGDTTPAGGGTIDPSASAPTPEVCNDGIDNDGNGVTDCTDVACASDAACAPAPIAEVCNDGVDNDGNGVTDCTDLACSSDAACGGDGTTKVGPIDPDKYKVEPKEPDVGPGPECLSCPDDLTTWEEQFVDPAPVEAVKGYREEYRPSGSPFDKNAMLSQKFKAGVREYTQ